MVEKFGLSDVGCVRELNEDCFCIHGFDSQNERGFCILADGMGGHNAGEVASQSAVTFIAEELTSLLELQEDVDIPARLITAIDNANEKVFSMSMKNSIHNGMGTTVVVVFISNGIAYIANVGDSRAYALREKELIQITSDHSIVAELVKSGTITSDEARRHPQRNIITRAVGTDDYVKSDVFEYDYSKGDVLLMCSDGLCTMVGDEEIRDIIISENKSDEIVFKLVDTAKEYGGIDNITVICIRFI